VKNLQGKFLLSKAAILKTTAKFKPSFKKFSFLFFSICSFLPKNIVPLPSPTISFHFSLEFIIFNSQTVGPLNA